MKSSKEKSTLFTSTKLTTTCSGSYKSMMGS